MADTTSDNGTAPSDLKAKAAGFGQQVQGQAQEAFRSAAQVATDKFQEATDAAKDVVSGATDKLQEHAAGQQAAGANYLAQLADHLREAAQIFATDTPFAEKGISVAADHVEQAAEKLRTGNPRDLVTLASDYARRNPALFLGASAVAGFALIRFLKASARSGQEAETHES